MDVAIVTCREPPEPDVDEELLLEALHRAGIGAEVLAWDDPRAPFERARLALLRSTWNYPERPDEFLEWARKQGARLCNPYRVVRWNAHKSYLRELAEAGIDVVPTRWFVRGGSESLADAVSSFDGATFVVKPTIAAGSIHTRRVDRADLAAHEPFWRARLAERDMMVQPYIRSVEGHGERAIVVIDGEITHAVRKSPRFAGEQEQVSEALTVADDERGVAERAMRAAATRVPGASLLYARVDVVHDAQGAVRVMELELIEPSLFLLQCEHALERFVAAIGRRLHSQP